MKTEKIVLVLFLVVAACQVIMAGKLICRSFF